MPPDLSSVPPSPHPQPSSDTANGDQQQRPASEATAPPADSRSSRPASRRPSSISHSNMVPAPLPLGTPGGAIPASVLNGGGTGPSIPFPPLSPSVSASANEGMDSGVPVRHPQPMTPAELHNVMEKEQEFMVNRLSRELAALDTVRAHSSSVASSRSSTSASAPPTGLSSLEAVSSDPYHPASTRQPPPPHAARSRRSSSRQQSISDTPVSLIPLTPIMGPRTSSVSSTGGFTHSQAHGGPLMPTTSRYEEALLHRQEMEAVKAENERLRKRVRELEALVRGRRESSVSGASAARVDSASRTASVAGRASERDRSVSVRGVKEETVEGAAEGGGVSLVGVEKDVAEG